ncbi:MAG: hypothetical protein HY273_05185 [Gammaproteobacteria bacterium]|nr:hypothetical protein [Gammaproteobacteria bacterium]
MSTTRRHGSMSSSESGSEAAELPTLELPAAAEESRDTAASKAARVAKPIDYDDEKVKGRWKKIMDRQREELDTDVLTITPPRARLDVIAKTVLDTLCAKLIKQAYPNKEGTANKPGTPAELEKQVRAYITEKGYASEVKKVTDRLNARRITDGRRWVLSTTYIFLLAKLFQERATEIEELIKDDLGVAEKIMLDLEAEDGPLDVFANLVVKSVMERNRIGKSKTLLELVSQQVRSAI